MKTINNGKKDLAIRNDNKIRTLGLLHARVTSSYSHPTTLSVAACTRLRRQNSSLILSIGELRKTKPQHDRDRYSSNNQCALTKMSTASATTVFVHACAHSQRCNTTLAPYIEYFEPHSRVDHDKTIRRLRRF